MTSPIQKNLSKINPTTLKDENLLETYVAAWEYVCQENAADLHLISPTDAQQWVNYRDQNTEDLRKIVTNYYLYRALPEEHRTWLITEMNRIISATVKDKPTLEEEKRERERAQRPIPATPQPVPTDPYKRQEHLEQAEKQHGWLHRLGGRIFRD